MIIPSFCSELMVAQSEFKVFSQQIVAQVAKEAQKLEGEKHKLAAALKQSEQACAKVSSFIGQLCIHVDLFDCLVDLAV